MPDVTGRDGYIIAKALAYACVIIPYLPEALRELSDRDDMMKLLRATNRDAQYFLDMVAHTVAMAKIEVDDPPPPPA